MKHQYQLSFSSRLLGVFFLCLKSSHLIARQSCFLWRCGILLTNRKTSSFIRHMICDALLGIVRKGSQVPEFHAELGGLVFDDLTCLLLGFSNVTVVVTIDVALCSLSRSNDRIKLCLFHGALAVPITNGCWNCLLPLQFCLGRIHCSLQLVFCSGKLCRVISECVLHGNHVVFEILLCGFTQLLHNFLVVFLRMTEFALRALHQCLKFAHCV